MDDEQLHRLDHHYRIELGTRCTTVGHELHAIITSELESWTSAEHSALNRAIALPPPLTSSGGHQTLANETWLSSFYLIEDCATLLRSKLLLSSVSALGRMVWSVRG